jgi:hypothetical protein
MSKGDSIRGKERSDKRKPLGLNDKRKNVGKSECIRKSSDCRFIHPIYDIQPEILGFPNETSAQKLFDIDNKKRFSVIYRKAFCFLYAS